jgi:hypothetical protein
MFSGFRVATHYSSVDFFAEKDVPLFKGLFIYVCIYLFLYLFTDAVSVSWYTASNVMMINEWFQNSVKGTGRGLITGAILLFDGMY